MRVDSRAIRPNRTGRRRHRLWPALPDEYPPRAIARIRPCGSCRPTGQEAEILPHDALPLRRARRGVKQRIEPLHLAHAEIDVGFRSRPAGIFAKTLTLLTIVHEGDDSLCPRLGVTLWHNAGVDAVREDVLQAVSVS